MYTTVNRKIERLSHILFIIITRITIPGTWDEGMGDIADLENSEFWFRVWKKVL